MTHWLNLVLSFDPMRSPVRKIVSLLSVVYDCMPENLCPIYS